ncbi:MAG: hypothetical protein GDA49_06970 [Rhodospirillales bacterium]|nr:hypothetical protein [Rhodospirillales bacterium]
MPPLKGCLIAAAIAFPLSFQPALAEEDDPFAMAKETMKRLMLTLELLVAGIPQYEMPEVLENGDIIIRRVNPEATGDSNDDGVTEEEI